MQGNSVRFQLCGIAVYLYLSLHGSGVIDCSHAVDFCQRVNYPIVQYLPQCHRTLLCRSGNKENGDIVQPELKNHRLMRLLGKNIVQRTQLIAHIVGSGIYIGTFVKFKVNYRYVFAALTGDMLYVGNPVQRIFYRISEVGFYILRPGTR